MAFVVVTTKQKLFFSFKRDQNENRFKRFQASRTSDIASENEE